MAKDILLVDDQLKKYQEISSFFQINRSECNIEWVRNFRVAQNNILKRSFDLILLDMSFPVHGATSEDTTFEGLAGLHVLQFMWRTGIKTPVIICTSHVEYSDPTFGKLSGLDSLKRYTSETFGSVVADCVLLGSDSTVWHKALSEALIHAQI